MNTRSLKKHLLQTYMNMERSKFEVHFLGPSFIQILEGQKRHLGLYDLERPMHPYDYWKVAKNSEKSNLESKTEFYHRQADNDANKCYEISMYFKAGDLAAQSRCPRCPPFISARRSSLNLLKQRQGRTLTMAPCRASTAAVMGRQNVRSRRG
jgi:hypothetical protein